MALQTLSNRERMLQTISPEAPDWGVGSELAQLSKDEICRIYFGHNPEKCHCNLHVTLLLAEKNENGNVDSKALKQ